MAKASCSPLTCHLEITICDLKMARRYREFQRAEEHRTTVEDEMNIGAAACSLPPTEKDDKDTRRKSRHKFEGRNVTLAMKKEATNGSIESTQP